jgi:hypothetical protein
MPRADYKTCKSCGRHTSECGPISHRRLCGECGLARQTFGIIEQAEHNGPTFQHWRRRIVASAGGVILDDARSNP